MESISKSLRTTVRERETRWEVPALVGRRLFIHHNERGPGLKGSQRFGMVQQVVASSL